MLAKMICCGVLAASVFAANFWAFAADKNKDKLSDEFQVTIEVEPKRNLKTECSELVVEQSDLEKALSICTEAINEAPEDGDRYYFRSYAHYYRDDYEKAEADATRAIELKTSRLAKAYYLRGTIRERQRRLREAAADFKVAYDLSPDWAQARRKVESYEWAYAE